GVWVRIDADRFEQMLLNLVINARDAMERGGEVRVEIERLAGRDLDAEHQLDRSSAYAVLRVIDTGTGMDEQTLAHCFDPMFTTKGPFAGTGLGLAAARRLMEESGGSIVARSVLGQGTTFETALPLVGAPAPSATPAEPPAEPPVATGGAMILVVENDDGLRHLVAHVLRRNGYAVLEAASGEAALESLDASLDLVVSDVVMGEVSGVDLAARIPVEPGAPAILLVSGTADPSVLDGLAPRVCDFLAKPFRPSQLLDRVVELMARRGATR
ncbi:MAG: response regulator, partial [Actinomycetales bacterium]|nr:response regulator [Actinomycetales bacterium]